MEEWLKGFLEAETKSYAVTAAVIGAVIVALFGTVKRFFKWLGKVIWKGGKSLWKYGTNQIKRFREWREYKRTIKQIERKEIPVTRSFLLNKSPEKNPELRKIFEMLDSGEIKTPASLKLEEMFKKNPELKRLVYSAWDSKPHIPPLERTELRKVEPPNFED